MTIPIHHRSGSVGELHGIEPFGDGAGLTPEIWSMHFDRPALVLGSRQSTDIIDQRLLDVTDVGTVDVVRRRSGGGAVLMYPGDVVWVDVIVPIGFANDDLRASMITVGEMFVEALHQLDDTIALEVHRGGMVATPWSDLVCWAGIGPGEVTANGAKLVGLSQRRTRAGARIQAMLHRRDLVGASAQYFDAALVNLPSGHLPRAAVLANLDADALVHALSRVDDWWR